MNNETPSPYRIYTLHFAKPISGKLHYTGIAHVNNLEHRLQQHARAQGSNLTKRVVIAGVQIFLVEVREAPDFATETHLKRTQHASRRCAICRTELTHLKMKPRHLTSTLLPVPIAQHILQWPAPKSTDRYP